jgi:hypothetical protein
LLCVGEPILGWIIVATVIIVWAWLSSFVLSYFPCFGFWGYPIYFDYLFYIRSWSGDQHSADSCPRTGRRRRATDIQMSTSRIGRRDVWFQTQLRQTFSSSIAIDRWSTSHSRGVKKMDKMS